nr:hypothetical protein [uncultured Duganella sp.]
MASTSLAATIAGAARICGRAIAIAIHEFHQFSADRIVRTWHLEDWFGMLNQVGAWPPKAV